MKNYILFSLFIFFGCFSVKPSASELEKADYGTYPNNYEEIIKNWLSRVLFDPHSVEDLIITKPRNYYYTKALIDGGGTIYGYVVSIEFRAKNRLGGYVGLRYYELLIRNGEIVHYQEIYPERR